MRRKSHLSLGLFLAREYMPDISSKKRTAFLFGCVEPDHNPFTYCKGSLRGQWLRGHNYPNSHKFILKLYRRLTGKSHWTMLDYYALGKLIHYAADAFTFAHNIHFSGTLSQHRKYEEELQLHFLENLKPTFVPFSRDVNSFPEYLSKLHQEYLRSPPSPQNDVRFILIVCSHIMSSTEFFLCKYSSISPRKH